jgi:hypothetical protein
MGWIFRPWGSVRRYTPNFGNRRIISGGLRVGMGLPKWIGPDPGPIIEYTVGVPFSLDWRPLFEGRGTFAWTNATLPPGITLNAETGLMSGTATVGVSVGGKVTLSSRGVTASSPSEQLVAA